MHLYVVSLTPNRHAKFEVCIIGLTEVKSKSLSSILLPQELNIDGYTSYINMTDRGSALYIKNCYCATEYIPTVRCDASVWITVKLTESDTLVVGVVYRSPNASVQQSEQIDTMIRTVAGSDFY